jgi:hypothetical protein
MRHNSILIIFSSLLIVGNTNSCDWDGEDRLSLPPDLKIALEKNTKEMNPISFVWQSTYSTDLDLKSLCSRP